VPYFPRLRALALFGRRPAQSAERLVVAGVQKTEQKWTWWARRTLSVKTLNVGARPGGIASRGGEDADRVDCVRHFAVRVLPHVHHHRGDRLAYPADPEKRERALLAPLNVLFSCHRR
jgi:hypothetical protein